jgi:hypothetical protein
VAMMPLFFHLSENPPWSVAMLNAVRPSAGKIWPR